MNPPPATFLDFLRRGCEAGGFGTDDVLAAVLPLFRQVAEAHERGLVAPLEGADALQAADTRLFVAPERFGPPRRNPAEIEALQRQSDSGVVVVGHTHRTSDLDDGTLRHTDLLVGQPEDAPDRPRYYPGYVAWEHRSGHHDQLTDIHSLGLVLASLACGLDFTEPEDLALFARNRANLFHVNASLHPVFAGVIGQMTELDRHKRVQTLDTVILRLQHYRDQAADYAVDYRQLRGYRDSAPRERGQIILTHLRNRLFEISRRNRLIHFRPTLQTLNLTLASVPLLLDLRNIKPDQLFLWQGKIAETLAGGGSVVLGNYVRFEDAPYAASVLDQIISSERRDRNEFGFAQLRLVVCFLRWHNLKETPEERIHSPLLLLPVELTKKKGVRDAYVLRALTSEAEVNPALRHHLRQLYGLALPESVDLAATTVEAFHELLAGQIRASEPGVTLVRQDRPQIELIRERAQQRLDQFRRRQRLSARIPAAFGSLDYSYGRENFRPLGLQLFLHRVKPSPLPFAQTLGKAPAPRLPQLAEPPAGAEPATPAAPGETGAEKEFFALKNPDGAGNPYSWDFDLCSLTLGNFNYRKMSLVRDYASLLEQTDPGRAFESIFSLQPRTHDEEAAPAALAEQFPVVECDPTQMRAVTRARPGGSYIIQGPPGTGKSQTITNLIADYVARGRRVLFVCEKRAAIDVVFHRLGRQGLDDLCCLIHDSQADKREFIRNLKQTYDTFLNQPVDETLEPRRAELVRLMELELAALRRWSDVLAGQVAGCSLTVRDLLARLVELRDASVELDPLAREQVPPYALWTPHAELLRSLSAALARTSRSPALAGHSFRHLTERALSSPQPLATITAAVDACERLLLKLDPALDAVGDTVAIRTLADIGAVVDYAVRIAALAEADALDLLNARAPRTKKVLKALRDWRAGEAALAKAREATTHWRTPLPPADTAAALAQAQGFAGSVVAWLQPSYWRLRRVLADAYDFSAHTVRPTWTQVLATLAAEHAARDALAAARTALDAEFGEVPADTGINLLEGLGALVESLSPAARALHTYLLENPEAAYAVAQLAAVQPDMRELHGQLSIVLAEPAGLDRPALRAELRQLRADLVWLPDLLPLLADVLRLPAPLQHALRRLPLSDRQLEAAMALKDYDALGRADRTFEATTGGVLARRVARLQDYHREWLGVNARSIHQRVRTEFLRKVRISGLPAAQLQPAEKELKRLYATGRRELEHEFEKTMRYRSIRDLADDETGVVLRDLKPVWLMSPLSVSDTLPLAADVFDVVIFDEASQILVEEAVPAVARARQIIVVGDQMQLPPTNFFSASRGEEELADAGLGPVVEDLDAESFLTQAARNLPATMLGWHYRSRSEALISFSNHAFYEGRLLTVPDQRAAPRAAAEIQVRQPDDATARVADLLARSVSFHHLPDAVYENRRNQAEAEYIARLLRELLGREDRPSIGIVAFSEAQQGEIESAVSRLGEGDAAFRNRVEAEYEREDEGQFNGLFVKNLENVQGDERDIIILSICYGHDRNRRILMNFGPINQRGGEKRLNVIFSRARRHMAVVSSMRHGDITNDHNDGAACLRNFLEYAAATSVSASATARRVLQAANPAGPARATAPAPDVVATQLAAALTAEGWVVETHVGQSSFRVPLALRRAEDDRFALGILIDDGSHYAQPDLLERYLQRPGILRAFGWKLTTVYAKDWFHDPAAVLRQVGLALAGEEEPAVEMPEEETPALAAAEEPAPYVTAPAAPAAPAPVVPAPVVPPVLTVPSAVRRFTCTEDGASKFWESSVTGTELSVRFGRIGTKGQEQSRGFTTADAAQREQAKLIRSKLAKGYAEVPPVAPGE